MSQENETAETTELANEEIVSESGVNGNADINNQEDINDVEFTDTDSDEDSESKSDELKAKESEPEAKTNDLAEINAENARRRREEKREKELKKAREQAIIEVLNGKNPYTEEEIKDSSDIEEYLLMKQIADSGGDPLADYSKFQKQKVKQEKIKLEKQQKQNEWFQNDKEEFEAKYPDIKRQELFSDKEFMIFADGKIGNISMSKIYEDFLALQKVYENKIKRKAARIVANAAASPGSLNSPNKSDNGFYSKEQVQAMTPEEISKNYERVRASMTKWKY